MPELLLELLSEEIPARMQARAAEDLKRLVTDGLKEAGLEFTNAESYVTPRRLALVVDGIPEKLSAKTEERRGPRTDAPEQAVKGFRGSLPKGTKVEKRQTDKGEFYFAQVKPKGGPAKGLLPEILVGAIAQLGWPKSMRWGENKVRWVRPVHGILCVFGGKVAPVAFGPVNAADTTSGHPFLAPKPFKVKNFADYKAKLLKAKVVLDAAERAAIIEKEAQKLAGKAGLKLKHDPGLLAEVAGLVEWPVVRMGSIDKDFMGLPPEVLTTVMRHHQKYFALVDANGKLQPKFIVVANTETRDRGKAMVAGNERVLRARLADAKFFWDQDRKASLESRLGKLTERVFHAKLGSVHDKVIRIEQLSGEIADHCRANAGDAMWAARLCKADLSTEMVGEFPELQGVIGRYYALADKEKPEVADAIADHYSPLGPNDACPSKPVSIAVALADKIDTLAGFWAIGETPTGSKDPFALRRAALGVIRLIIENELTLAVRMVIEAAWKNYPEGGNEGRLNAFQEDLRAFVFARLKVHMRDKGHRHDLIDALFMRGGEDDLLRIIRKADVLGRFLETDDGANLLVAYRRANNIVQIEEKKDGEKYSGGVDKKLFSQNQEHALWSSLGEVEQADPSTPNMAEFDEVLITLAKLRGPVDRFFDEVTVNCDDPALRQNRLRLLSEITSCLNRVAVFSEIAGGEK